MINISSNELAKMDRIGSGTFGSVYIKNNKIFKIYHEKVNAYNKILGVKDAVFNPCLRCNIIKYNYLKNINFKLKYTDLIDDILYVDEIFSGVVMPYYNGKLLKDYINNSIEEKVFIAKQLLRNAKELTDNYIYPLDYKENNIIINDNKIQIIDLDDKMTKVLNPIYKAKSIKVLDDTIKRFIYSFDNNALLMEEITKQGYSKNNTYKKINDYLNLVLKDSNHILVHNNMIIKEKIRSKNI